MTIQTINIAYSKKDAQLNIKTMTVEIKQKLNRRILHTEKTLVLLNVHKGI